MATDTPASRIDPGAYISGYHQLSRLGVGFYPVHADKSPAIGGKLDRVATQDPIKIAFWAEHCHHRRFAARLPRNCRLLVIDTESPHKRPDRLCPDGEMFLASLLEDSGVTLPRCPAVQTASGGFHRYLHVPKGYRIRPHVALWPGIDILAAGSNVILPGNRAAAGEHCVRRSFEECSIPEAPREFIKLIRKAEKAGRCSEWVRPRFSAYLNEADTSSVSRRQWYLLFRNRVFRSFWRRQGKAGDATDSAYEYHLAKACFCCGLNARQTESVILLWRSTHGLKRDLRQLRDGILPAAWREVGPWVERWHAERNATKQKKTAAKTANIILAQMKILNGPQTPASIAVALSIPRDRAKQAMWRMARDGKLVRTADGYQLVTAAVTF